MDTGILYDARPDYDEPNNRGDTDMLFDLLRGNHQIPRELRLIYDHGKFQIALWALGLITLDEVVRFLVQLQREPKSVLGPLGPVGPVVEPCDN